MPLASPQARPDVVYGFGRIDASGRVADRATIAALGWRGGDRPNLTAEAGMMIARRDPGGIAARVGQASDAGRLDPPLLDASATEAAAKDGELATREAALRRVLSLLDRARAHA